VGPEGLEPSTKGLTVPDTLYSFWSRLIF